jgi:hypothetical protein
MSNTSTSTIAAVSVGFTHESSLQLEANVARPKNTKLASNMLMKFFFISNPKIVYIIIHEITLKPQSYTTKKL